MILSGKTIRDLGIISPHSPKQTYNGMSFGESYAGYDIRIRESVFLDFNNPFSIASTLEHFAIPKNIVGIVHDKSSWARQGLSVFNTVLEPGWRGYLTLELAYHDAGFLEILKGSPIAQVVFHYLDQEVESYDGKYQDQPNVPVRAIRAADN